MWTVFLRHFTRTALFFTILFSSFFISSAQPVLSFGTAVVSGLSSPVDIVAEPGSTRLFIVQQGGLIRIVSGNTILATPFLSLNSSVILAGGERGLLSMAFHPDYGNPANRFFYLLYNNTAGDITLARYQTQAGNPDQADPASGVVLLNIPKPFDNHNGGDINFGPDGYLYFGTGDGGDGNDPQQNGQNANSLLGKMLRLQVNTSNVSPYHTIPADNPFIGLPNTRSEIFALGLRNPWRWSFDRANGDMWIADVGQGAWEEVNRLPFNSTPQTINFGWRCREGNHPTPGVPACTPTYTYVPPIFEYGHNNVTGGFSITGGFVYRGSVSANAPLLGYFVCADYVSGNVWMVRSDGTSQRQSGLPGNISSFGEANNGELYAVSRATNSLYLISVSGTLPVRLVTFTGKNEGSYNELHWTTAEEDNLASFIVEASADGRNFQPVGTVAPLNTASSNSYSFKHTVAAASRWFYRLRIQHLTATESFSTTVRLGSENINTIKVYPTIVRTNSVNVLSSFAIERVDVYSSRGQQVHTKAMQGETGFFTLTLPSLPKGVYLLQVSGNNVKKTEKIIVE